ncbi:hypothetical protein GH714_016633 [Hevea brasiliensis]|uniref:Uncharacterized protein n=1 Tax=Hevea brasiliensis TaxID=3981 RepID=A0A6A6NHV5_HEVBR|nr:hypothetical protein GH714_016633 [Hevea brasiliensis]
MTGILLLSIGSLSQKYRIHDLQEDTSALKQEQQTLTDRLNNIKRGLLHEAALDPTGLFAARLRILFGEEDSNLCLSASFPNLENLAIIVSCEVQSESFELRKELMVSCEVLSESLMSLQRPGNVGSQAGEIANMSSLLVAWSLTPLSGFCFEEYVSGEIIGVSSLHIEQVVE